MALYCMVDDLLRALSHREDCRRRILDAEVIITALVAARFFGGNHQQSRDYLDEHGLVPQMLSPSRLNRRLHQVAALMYTLQQQLGYRWMQLQEDSEYLLASFPVYQISIILGSSELLVKLANGCARANMAVLSRLR